MRPRNHVCWRLANWRVRAWTRVTVCARDDPPESRSITSRCSRLLRGDRSDRPGGLEQGANFVDEAVVEHLHDAAVDPRAKFFARALEREDRDAGRGRAVVLVLKGAERPSGGRGDFQGANDPPLVVRVQARGRERIELREPRVQGRAPLQAGLGFKLLAEVRVGAGPFEQTAKQGLEIEGRTSHEHSPTPPRHDLCDHVDGPAPILRHAGRFPGVEHVDQVMRNSLALGEGRFCRADIHAAIKRHRIERDDLGPDPARQRDTNGRLPRGCRSGQVNGVMKRVFVRVHVASGFQRGRIARSSLAESVDDRPDAHDVSVRVARKLTPTGQGSPCWKRRRDRLLNSRRPETRQSLLLSLEKSSGASRTRRRGATESDTITVVGPD